MGPVHILDSITVGVFLEALQIMPIIHLFIVATGCILLGTVFVQSLGLLTRWVRRCQVGIVEAPQELLILQRPDVDFRVLAANCEERIVRTE